MSSVTVGNIVVRDCTSEQVYIPATNAPSLPLSFNPATANLSQHEWYTGIPVTHEDRVKAKDAQGPARTPKSKSKKAGYTPYAAAAADKRSSRKPTKFLLRAAEWTVEELHDALTWSDKAKIKFVSAVRKSSKHHSHESASCEQALDALADLFSQAAIDGEKTSTVDVFDAVFESICAGLEQTSIKETGTD